MANTYSLQLNGTSQYVTAATWQPTVLTLSSWIKPTAVNARVFITSLDHNDVIFAIESDGKIGLEIWNGASMETYKSTNTVSINVWTFVAGTYNQATKAWAIYIGTGSTANNSGTGTSALSWEDGTTSIAIGGGVTGGSVFPGLIDDSRLWSTVRSGANLASDCSQELIGNEANLYGYYKWNNDFTDSDDSPHNGTGVNSPTFSTDIPPGKEAGTFFALL
jgi:hypothetical protein